MFIKISNRIRVLILVLLTLVFFSGCRTSAGFSIGTAFPVFGPSYYEGPPPWLPAHVNHPKHTYRYYPYHGIYFEERTRIYFYMTDGRWQASASLPAFIRITVNDFITLDMDSDRPYVYHKYVIKRYPPRQKQNKWTDQDTRKGNKRDD
jgi:hypothetical protein